MTSDADRPRTSGISHLGLSVTNLDRSLAFYRDILGAEVIRETHGGSSEAFSGRLTLIRVGSLALDLYQHAANLDERFDPARTGLDHLAFATDSSEDLAAWARWLDQRGIPRSPIRAVYDIGSMFDFADPDGIQIELFFLDREKLGHSTVYPSAGETGA